MRDEKAECGDVGLPILFVLAVIVGIGVHHELTKPTETQAMTAEEVFADASLETEARVRKADAPAPR